MLQYKSLAFKAAGDGLAENEFAGYASVFGVVDEDGDIVKQGAFKAHLDFFLKSGLICWQHYMREPIGKPLEAREDSTGLFLKARISDTTQGRDCLTLMRDDVVRKLSIGYVVKGASLLSEDQAKQLLGEKAYSEAMDRLPKWVDQLRLITEVKLYEVSPVSFPSNGAAEITAVKSHGRLPETEREYERFLREAGYSRKDALALSSGGFKALQRDAGECDEVKDLLASLQQAQATLAS